MRAVAVTGIGGICPIGNNIPDIWSNLKEGLPGAGPITLFDAKNFKTKIACEVKDYAPEAVFGRREVRRLDRFMQFALIAAKEAIEDSGVDFDSIDPHKAGVIWASGNGGYSSTEQELEYFYKNGEQPKFNPFFIPKTLVDSASGVISIAHGLKGVTYNPVAACASSTQAIIDAAMYVGTGKADFMVAGGSDAAISVMGIGGFGALKALSDNNEAPKKASRPFDTDRNGFVMGEGGAGLVLEPLDKALKNGRKVYGIVAGGGLTSDAYHITSGHPQGEGVSRSMGLAFEEAGIKAQDIDLINPHATSTPVGDSAEIEALKGTFNAHLEHVYLTPTKALTGHLLGAAGAIEAVFSLLSLYHQEVPPVRNLDTVDPGFEVQPKLNATLVKNANLNHVLSNSIGFGGHNASVVFSKYQG